MQVVIIFTQLRRHTINVLQNNDVDVILDMSYIDDETLQSLSERIKVLYVTSAAHHFQMNVQMHTHIHTCTHAHIMCVCTCACLHVCMHTHIYTHTHTRTCTHTHTQAH